MKIVACLGPFDQPNERREVTVIRAHDMPGFWICKDGQGRQLVVHGQKLEARETEGNGA